MAAHLKINPLPFYSEWSGHPLGSLSTIHAHIRALRPSAPVVFLAGDSSLDNKAWIPSAGPGGSPLPANVPSIYTTFLDPAVPKPDVAFWLNKYMDSRATTLNTAIEATMLRDRDTALLPHDEFIRDHIRTEDVLVVSVGANDIALNPNTATMRHMFQLAWLTPMSSIENGTASSLKYFQHMFQQQTTAYVSRLVATTKPKAVVICTIYFPLEGDKGQTGWADAQLKMLGYNRDPRQLQAAIRKMYEQATAQIKIEGVKVVPCAFFEVLDGQHREDYTARVEPSVEGGRKMAELLASKIDGILMNDHPSKIAKPMPAT